MLLHHPKIVIVSFMYMALALQKGKEKHVFLILKWYFILPSSTISFHEVEPLLIRPQRTKKCSHYIEVAIPLSYIMVLMSQVLECVSHLLILKDEIFMDG